MKIRVDLITNSSSSNFIIQKDHLNHFQLMYLLLGAERCREFNLSYPDSYWEVYEYPNELRGHTDMDSFDMEEYMKLLGIDLSLVKFYEF